MSEVLKAEINFEINPSIQVVPQGRRKGPLVGRALPMPFKQKELQLYHFHIGVPSDFN